jgi:hypothetical protein
MCKPPKPPASGLVTPAPLEAPRPMASPDPAGGMNVSQLRIGSRNNLKMRAPAAATAATANAATPAAPTGATSLAIPASGQSDRMWHKAATKMLGL